MVGPPPVRREPAARRACQANVRGFSTARYCAAHAACPVLVVPLPTLRTQPDVAVVDASEL